MKGEIRVGLGDDRVTVKHMVFDERVYNQVQPAGLSRV